MMPITAPEAPKPPPPVCALPAGSKAKRTWEEVAFPLTDDRSVHVFSDRHQVYNCFSFFGFTSSSPLSQEHSPSPDLLPHQTAAKTRTAMDDNQDK